jgi:long-chain fatty acid transport protein
VGGAPVYTSSGNGGNGGGVAFLPHGYWVWGVNDRLSVGLGVGPTYGSVTEYNDDFIGRNAGYFFDLQQINVNPSVAWKVNETVSLGAGLNIAHNATHFKQGVPFFITGVVAPGTHADIKGDAWAVGWNVGAMFQLTPSTRLGLTYRSGLSFDIKGDMNYIPGSVVLANEQVKAKLKTPGNFSVALSQTLGNWELLGDFTWTNWSVIDSIPLIRTSDGGEANRLKYNFRDSWRVGLGANYRSSEDLKLRFGVAYDKTPVRSPEDRTMTLPDTDRYWLSLGLNYALGKHSSLDVSYSHIFFRKGDTARAVELPGVPIALQTIRGQFSASANIFSLQLNHHF